MVGLGHEDEIRSTTRIVVTDGTHSRDVAVVAHTGRNAYLFYGIGSDHISYHASGQLHQVEGGVKTSKSIQAPLAEVKGIFSLMTIGLTGGDLIHWPEVQIPRAKEPGTVLVIDHRAFPQGERVDMLVTLVEPGLMEKPLQLMQAVRATGMSPAQLLIETRTTPWVCLFVTTGSPRPELFEESAL